MGSWVGRFNTRFVGASSNHHFVTAYLNL